LLRKTLRIDPDHPESHYNLGIAYSEKGLLEESQQEMLRAIQLRNKKKELRTGPKARTASTGSISLLQKIYKIDQNLPCFNDDGVFSVNF